MRRPPNRACGPSTAVLRTARSGQPRPGQGPCALTQSNAMAAKEHSRPTTKDAPRSALPKDSSRPEMMRRQKQMTAEQRLTLFERLARFATWARSARRVR